MRISSDRDKRLRGALAAVDDAVFGVSPKGKYDLDRTERETRAKNLKALNQRFRQLDEYYSRAVAEIQASFSKAGGSIGPS